MDIITSHNSLDFDGLAAMVAAGKIYPSAVKVFSGMLSKNVKQFMGLYKDSLMIKTANDINVNRVKRVILVDTRNPNRLGALKDLVNCDCEFIIYDHHPGVVGDIDGTINEVHMVGAATTILVEKIMEAGITITPFEATILALGIYEDTGSLLFSSTTARDARAVSFLLENRANLSVVNNFIERPFTSEQRQLMQNLVSTLRHYDINGIDVAVATSVESGFTPGLDLVVHRLLEVEACEAIFAVAIMQGKANIVARSRTSNISVHDVLAEFGGRGHDKAASAVVKNKDPEFLVETILCTLQEKAKKGLLARDIMTTPVKTIGLEFTMEEAGKTMLRYGHTGMPVVDGERIVGIISRRDVDKARMHNLGHAPVKGFMSTSVLSATSDTPVVEIQKIMVEKDIGRLPIIDDGRLVGIISRTDILRTLHGDEYPEDHSVLYDGFSGERMENCREIMEQRLPLGIKEILEIAGNTADMLGCNIYCVGGFVRDLILGVPNFDIDLVVEGDGMDFARLLAFALGGKPRIHERFKTAVVVLPDGTKIDIATARTEYYEFPAALPRVERSSIKEDMYRRDFTINTLAICLNQARFGEIIDYFGGIKDLKEGLIRILYNFSFIEDPTRILRAIRFEQRLKFRIEPDTLRLAHDAIQRRLLENLSFKRIQQELILILSEKDPLPALKRMEEIGVWEYVLPEVKLDEKLRFTLRRIPRVLGWMAERQLETGLRPWVVYLEVICSNLSSTELEVILSRYSFDKHTIQSLKNALTIPETVQEIQKKESLKMSELDEIMRQYSSEIIAWFLLCLDQENTWELVTRYLEIKDDNPVEANGNTLKQMGIKQGPIYQEIFKRLRAARLDGEVTSLEDEIRLIKRFVEENECLTI